LKAAISHRVYVRGRRFFGLQALLVLTWAIGPFPLHAAPVESPLLLKRAPSFTRTDLTGKQIRLQHFRGKVVLLNFWATWCGPCLIELPRFGAWQRKYGPAGLQVIAVSMDDDPTPVRNMVRKLQLEFPVVMGDERLGTLYGRVLGLPVTYVIDRKGRVSTCLPGEADLDGLELRIEGALATE
jgi:cytochrome c biogenesis protein CcmG, thiol:disulfide interchange protein DsbE